MDFDLIIFQVWKSMEEEMSTENLSISRLLDGFFCAFLENNFKQ